ncbi:MAG: MoxR family ATPase [Acidobacteria bacterium]|nr:MoxR family ATPase [Acidobacteriota bacterium]
MNVETLGELAQRVLHAVEGVVIGQRQAAEMLLAGFLADGHVLVEGVPGIGKTLLAQATAGALGLELKRVQLTPDFMPADLLGANVFRTDSGSFDLVRGPVFAQVLLADEINRTPPRTQAALLEAMEERQVTIDGETHALDPSFFVIATENPIEFEGTYPLPEAQLDRFLLRVTMAPVRGEAELTMLEQAAAGDLAGWGRRSRTAEPVLDVSEASALRQASGSVHVAPDILDYIQRLAGAVGGSQHAALGVSPRALLALMETSRAVALLGGRTFVLPDDVKAALGPCWAHRVLLEPESELEGVTTSGLLHDVAETVEVPH